MKINKIFLFTIIKEIKMLSKIYNYTNFDKIKPLFKDIRFLWEIVF